jgi:hypothetical protein
MYARRVPQCYGKLQYHLEFFRKQSRNRLLYRKHLCLHKYLLKNEKANHLCLSLECFVWLCVALCA